MKRKILIYLEKYPYGAHLLPNMMHGMISNGVILWRFRDHLINSTYYKVPLKWRLRVWFPTFSKLVKVSEAHNKLVAVKRSRIFDNCLRDCFAEGLLEPSATDANAILDQNYRYLVISNEGRKMMGWWYCFNKSLKDYGEIKSVIIATVASPLLIKFLMYLYHLFFK